MKELEQKWNVSARTLQNWRALGEKVGEAPPLETAEPGELVEWYRKHVGREPGKKVKAAARALRAAQEPAGPGREVAVPMAPVEAIAAALDALGLSRTMARLVEEDERAWRAYELAREEGAGEDGARRSWKEITEAKRAAQKTEDAVQVALELFKQWMRAEWEPVERARRAALGGKEAGLAARASLLQASTEGDWVREWDRAMERALGI